MGELNTMTNRTKYCFFSQFDDPQINECLERGENVILCFAYNFFVLTKKTSDIGCCLSLTNPHNEKVAFNKFINRDCPDIETFLKQAKDYI